MEKTRRAINGIAASHEDTNSKKRKTWIDSLAIVIFRGRIK